MKNTPFFVMKTCFISSNFKTKSFTVHDCIEPHDTVWSHDLCAVCQQLTSYRAIRTALLHLGHTHCLGRFAHSVKKNQHGNSQSYLGQRESINGWPTILVLCLYILYLTNFTGCRIFLSKIGISLFKKIEMSLIQRNNPLFQYLAATPLLAVDDITYQ